MFLLVAAACSSKPTPTQVEPSTKPIAPAPQKPVAIAFVIEGHEMWMGNDKLDLPEHERYPGALEPLRAAFAKVTMTSAATAGSLGALITYGDKAVLRHPMRPLGTLTAAALGEQKDYAGIIERDLVGGVTLGLDELVKVKDAQRVLVVIGDATDSNADKAKDALAALGTRAAAENVKLVSLIYKGILSSPENAIAAFDPRVMTVNSMDMVQNELEILFDGLAPPRAVVGNGIALALLVSGQEVWMGNDDMVTADDPARYTGALKAIRAALDQKPMSNFPTGSEGMILRYDSHLRTVQKLGPIERIDADAIGDQKSYFAATGSELVQGVRGALTQLAQVEAARRVLVILGDGNDTNNEAAKAQLRALRATAAGQNVEVHAIIFKAALSPDTDVIRELDPSAMTAKTSDDITSQLSTLLRSLR